MTVSAEVENIAAMSKRLDHLMHRFPWVQMVLFSELAAFGPAPKHAQPLPGPAEGAFCEMATRFTLIRPEALTPHSDVARSIKTRPVIIPP